MISFWSDSDFANLEPVPDESDLFASSDAEISFEGLPSEISSLCVFLDREDVDILRSRWQWMTQAAHCGYEMEDDFEAVGLYCAAQGEKDPDTPIERLWLRISPVIKAWLHLNSRLEKSILARQYAIDYAKNLESIDESHSVSVLSQAVTNLLNQIECLNDQISYLNEQAESQKLDHRDDINKISEAIKLKGLRLSEKINNRYTIFGPNL